MNLGALRASLIAHEGLRLRPYVDTAGKMSIGVGRNLTDTGISEAEAMLLLDHDILAATVAAGAFPWWGQLDDVRQRVFVELVFNMGLDGVLTFRKMLAHTAEGEFSLAANELLDSRWAGQARARVGRTSGAHAGDRKGRMSIQDTVVELRKDYGATMSNNQCADLLNEVAFIHAAEGWGLLADRGGNFATRFDGTKVEVDILFNRTTAHHYDALGDGGGASTPAWQDDGLMDLSRWVAPIPPLQAHPVPPDPPPTPPPPPATDLAARVVALERAAKKATADLADLTASVAGMADLIAQIPEPSIGVEGYRFRADCGRSWGHAHPVTIYPERKP